MCNNSQDKSLLLFVKATCRIVKMKSKSTQPPMNSDVMWGKRMRRQTKAMSRKRVDGELKTCALEEAKGKWRNFEMWTTKSSKKGSTCKMNRETRGSSRKQEKRCVIRKHVSVGERRVVASRAVAGRRRRNGRWREDEWRAEATCCECCGADVMVVEEDPVLACLDCLHPRLSIISLRGGRVYVCACVCVCDTLCVCTKR